jgi:hypothetical protein
MTDPKKLILFMAHFCWNCTSETSFAEQVEGRLDDILTDFQKIAHYPADSSKFVLSAYSSAAEEEVQ